jgi:photosystem II stability/assembly factor-like uncharacterized protein
MQKEKLKYGLVALLVATLSPGCNNSNKNSNSANANRAASARSARWIAQFRSPYLADFKGSDLELFSYSGISVLSKEVVFVCGDMPDPKKKSERLGVVVRTTDGGRNWIETLIEQPGMHIDSLNAIHFISPQVGWSAGVTPNKEAVFLKTTDGGASWSAVRLSQKQLPTSIFFIDQMTGWMGGATSPPGLDEDVGGPSAILATTDGGQSWTPQITLPLSINTVFFRDRSNGWAGGTAGAIYHTSDGGRTWNSQHTELEPGIGQTSVSSDALQFQIFGIHFLDTEHGYAAAGDEENNQGRMLATDNGGATWRRAWVVGDSGVRDILFIDPQEGWGVTDRGQYVYHTIDGARSFLAEQRVFEQDVSLVRLGAADASHVWAVGGGAIFFRAE